MSTHSSLENLPAGSHIHFLGICGTAMASLAGLLQAKGYKITGSDANPYPPMSTQIEKLGIHLYAGYDAKNVTEKVPDFVIIGNVISRGNVEVEEVLRRQLPYTSLAKAMGEAVIENRKSFVVSGTHGKTTTTSLLAWIFEVAGRKPGYLIGGIPLNFEYSFAMPKADCFVIEGDEYDTAFFDKVPKFIHYRPSCAILTSVEFDHADIYKDLDDVKRAFSMLLEVLTPKGTLVYWQEHQNVREVVAPFAGKKISYGIHAGDYQAKYITASAKGVKFDAFQQGEKLGTLESLLSGEYNVLNSLSAMIVAIEQGIAFADIQRAFLSFKGVKRRQEILGEPRGILVIEDFAHHPTAVKLTLEGLKQKYPERRLLCAFEPRSATSRRKFFQHEYGRAFQVADYSVIAQAYDQSKIAETDRFSSAELVADINVNSKSELGESTDDVLAKLVRQARPGDVIVLMSNGGFGGIYPRLLKQLETAI